MRLKLETAFRVVPTVATSSQSLLALMSGNDKMSAFQALIDLLRIPENVE
jgi:hypothetical protein